MNIFIFYKQDRKLNIFFYLLNNSFSLVERIILAYGRHRTFTVSLCVCVRRVHVYTTKCKVIIFGSCVRSKELACRVAVRVLSTIDFHRLSVNGGDPRARPERGQSRARAVRVTAGRHRPQDGQRAAAGARAARRGADSGPPEAALGPAILAAAPRGARRRRQARHHTQEGARHTQQTHSREVPKAKR